MPPQLGVDTAANPPVMKNLYGAGPRTFERGTIQAGAKYVRGEVLARTGDVDEKLYKKLARETVVSTAEAISNTSANSHQLRTLANANILPSTFSIERGSNTDMPVNPETGEITTGVTGARARINFKTGTILFTLGGTALTGMSCMYSYMDDDEQAAVVCIGDIDLSDDTAGDDDHPYTVLAQGAVIAGDLTWPTGATDAEIARQREVLRAAGIIVQDY